MNKKLIGSLVVIVAVIILIVLVSNKNNSNVEGLNKVGMISILSGTFADAGQEMANGAILASEIYNQKNPENQIDFILEDDGYDAKKGLSAYKKLTGLDNVDGLINVSTATIGGIYDLFQSDEKILLQIGEQPTEPEDDLVYGLFPGSIEAEKELGKYLKSEGYKKPLIVYTVDDTAIRFKDAIVEGYGDGMEEAGIPANEEDMRTHVLKTTQKDYDVIVIAMFSEPGAKFISQSLKQGVKLPQLAFDTIAGGLQDYKRILGDTKVLDGSIIVTFGNKTSSEFIDLYKNKFNREPGLYADVGYDAFNLLVETYSENPKKWKDNIQNISYDGANGIYKFDDVGIRLPDTVITKIQNGEIVIKN